MLKDPVFLAKNNIDPERRRCALDWWAYAAAGLDNGGKTRDVIMVADLDPVPAIFHEVGHFLQNNENYLGRMQRASHHGVFSNGFASLVSFLCGLGGEMVGYGVAGEVVGWITTLFAKFPTLEAEFMASWYGLQLMKQLGATDKDLENAKYALKAAYSTYVMSVLDKMGNSAYGRITGIGWNWAQKNGGM